MKSQGALGTNLRGSSVVAGAEDIHHFVEMALIEKLGPLGAKLHTGRSRNELIATDFRLFIKDASAKMRGVWPRLISRRLWIRPSATSALPMPGMTHMQHGQPILFAHFLLAHAEAFHRDSARIGSALQSADACPMGSGALAGCAFAIDRERRWRTNSVLRAPPRIVLTPSVIAISHSNIFSQSLRSARIFRVWRRISFYLRRRNLDLSRCRMNTRPAAA